MSYSRESVEQVKLNDAFWSDDAVVQKRIGESGHTYYLLSTESHTSQFRCDEATFKAIIKALQKQSLPDHLAQEVSDAIFQLSSAGILALQLSMPKRNKFFAKSPVAFHLKLFNPDTFLSRMSSIGQVMFSPFLAAVFFLLLGATLLALPTKWGELSSHWEVRFFDPVNLLTMIVIYPVMKVLHEIGHGLAIKKYGGRVRECGLFFLVFMPLPYVNASSSYFFRNKQHRIIVGLAGVYFDLFIAAIAFWIWSHTQGTVLADWMFNIVLIGSISSIAFNLNPLLKFDGYHVMSDWLGIFNLSSRANNALSSGLARFLYNFTYPAEQQSGSKFIWLYSCLSIPYRLFISFLIIFYLSTSFFFIGVLLACLVIFQLILFPLFHLYRAGYKQAKDQSHQKRFHTVNSLMSAIILAVLFIPHSGSIVAPAILNMEPESYVIANQSGSVEFLSGSGEELKSGDTILSAQNSNIRLKRMQFESELRQLELNYQRYFEQDALTAANYQSKIRSKQYELAEQRALESKLELKAERNGSLVINDPNLRKGQFVQQGDLLGYLFKPEDQVFVAVLSQSDYEWVSTDVKTAEIKFLTAPNDIYQAEIIKVYPSADAKLPSRYLGTVDGGDVAVSAKPEDNAKALYNYFQVHLKVVEPQSGSVLPARAYVKFYTQDISLFDRMAHWVRDQLIKHYSWAV